MPRPPIRTGRRLSAPLGHGMVQVAVEVGGVSSEATVAGLFTYLPLPFGLERREAPSRLRPSCRLAPSAGGRWRPTAAASPG